MNSAEITQSRRAIPRTIRAAGEFEVWGRGTNRVIDACKRHGAAPPIFEEYQGFLVVTFKAEMGVGAATPQVAGQVGAEVSAQVAAEVATQVLAFCRELKPAKAIMAELELKHCETRQTKLSCALDGHGHSGTDHPQQAGTGCNATGRRRRGCRY